MHEMNSKTSLKTRLWIVATLTILLIPGAALAEGIDWQWESFPEYLDAFVADVLGHGQPNLGGGRGVCRNGLCLSGDKPGGDTTPRVPRRSSG